MDIIVTFGLMALSGGVGYYLGHRGIAGVESDIDDIKTDVVHIKAKLEPSVVVNAPKD